MKTLRKIGMAILAVVLCMGFVACSDDDDENLNPDSTISGEWAVTDFVGSSYDIDEGKWISFEEHHNMDSLKDGDERMSIIPIGDNEFVWKLYEYYNGQWMDYSPNKVILRGKYLSDKDNPSYYGEIVEMKKNRFKIYVQSNQEKCTYTFNRILR